MSAGNESGSDPNDPVQKDAKTIADAAADLGRAREREMADDSEDRELAAEEQVILAKRAAESADKKAQQDRERSDEKVIADADADAQSRTGGAPGPTPPPQPPRPRVG